jgi:hypothetical protein
VNLGELSASISPLLFSHLSLSPSLSSIIFILSLYIFLYLIVSLFGCISLPFSSLSILSLYLSYVPVCRIAQLWIDIAALVRLMNGIARDQHLPPPQSAEGKAVEGSNFSWTNAATTIGPPCALQLLLEAVGTSSTK